MEYVNLSSRLIKGNESCVLKIYDDATGTLVRPGDRLQGHPTIGWGRALDIQGLHQHEADRLLRHDTEAAVASLKQQHWPFWKVLSAWRKAVLVDMTYNMGIGHLLEFSNMICALEDKNYSEAARQIKHSAYFHQTGRRARQNCCIMKFNRYITHQNANHYLKNHTL